MSRAFFLLPVVLALLCFAFHWEAQAVQPDKSSLEAAEIRPFKIKVDDALLRGLKERLARTRFPDQIEGNGWDYGVDLGRGTSRIAG